MEHLISTQLNIENDAISQNGIGNRIAADGSALVIIVRASDMKILFVNKQVTYYLGYDGNDLQGADFCFTDLIEGYQVNLLKNQLLSVVDNIAARSHFIIYRVRGKDNTLKPYYMYASPVNNIDDQGLFHLLMIPDLSKWGVPFTSFETKEIFLEQFKGDSFGTFEWIIDDEKVYWSAGVYKIFEVDQEFHEVTNDFIMSFVHPHDLEKVRKATQASMKIGVDLNVEFKIITARHNIKILHCLGRIIRNDSDARVKMAGSIRDITEQRLIEENLKNKVEELNHSNKELEEFAYVASHDIQEPLRKITTFSDRLSEKYKDVLKGDGALYLSRIIASAENMRTLINELLEFSRISKTEQPFEKTNLNVTLRDVKTDLELTIEETGTVIYCQELPVVEAIPSQMKQLFINIITNAIKFHKEGVAPVINIESTVLTTREKIHFDLLPVLKYYKIQVTDNGIGFEEEYANRIFQVFQRLHGKSEYPGTGIGLAICKKILEYHHGIIFAENIPGTGARFVFILPVEQGYLPDKKQ